MQYSNLTKTIEIIRKLRDPKDGCPWDLEQDHKSLLKYLIEESYEYCHAVEEKNTSHMEEELGDVLLQVLLHSQIASETDQFDIESVAKVLGEKMILRHPHVFKDKSIASTSEEVLKNWKEIKAIEKRKDVPAHNHHITKEDAYAPALLASNNIGQKSGEINFDWDQVDDVLKKVEEELDEVKEEMKIRGPKEKMEEEIGDLLFSVAQLSRHLDIEPENALKQANLKFIKRVNLVEDKVTQDGHQMTDLKTSVLEEYWQKVKQELKNSDNN